MAKTSAIQKNKRRERLVARYANKRAEMWSRLRDWLEQGGALHDSPEVMADLVVPLFDFDNPRNAMRLESKDSIRKRGMPSPDVGDAYALTFAFAAGFSRQAPKDVPPIDDQGVPTVRPRGRVEFAETDDPWAEWTR